MEHEGPVNIFGNTGTGNLKRDHRLFLSLHYTGPLVILNVECTGPLVISMWDFNFMLKSHSYHTGLREISNTGPKIISSRDFNGFKDNFQLTLNDELYLRS